jgi:hypothetical protein
VGVNVPQGVAVGWVNGWAFGPNFFYTKDARRTLAAAS